MRKLPPKASVELALRIIDFTKTSGINENLFRLPVTTVPFIKLLLNLSCTTQIFPSFLRKKNKFYKNRNQTLSFFPKNKDRLEVNVKVAAKQERRLIFQ